MLYFFGRVLGATIVGCVVIFVLLVYGGSPGDPGEPSEPALLATFILTPPVGVVWHELGHLLACLALGAQVKEFRLGGKKAAIRFRVRSVQVSLGWPYAGLVRYEGARSVWRRALIGLAGPVAHFALAGIALLISVLVGRGHQAAGLMTVAAVMLAASGLLNLIPIQTRSGSRSDGARLLDLRSERRTRELAAVRSTAQRLLRAGRTKELAELHAGLNIPAAPLSAAQAAILTLIEATTVVAPCLPDDAARLADRRVAMLLREHDLGKVTPMAYLTLALLRLRQGGQDNCATAERHCEQGLAAGGFQDDGRHLALAAIVVSRKARSLPYEDVSARVNRDDLDRTVAVLKAILDPEAILDDFRNGDPDARQGVGSIAQALRRQGRTADLLEVHARFDVPAGRHAPEQARSLHEIECNLLVAACLPSDGIDVAATRVQWILDNYPFKADKDKLPRPAVEHSLALARLRQGRFDEVEPLCASALASDYGPDARATILATIAMARRALGQPYANLIAEAVALSPDADLVAEAAGPVPATHR